MAARKPPSKASPKVPARKPAGSTAARQAARSSAKTTISGPSHKAAAAVNDAASAKIAGQELLAESMPHNKAKPGEHGAAASQPPQGQSIEPPHPIGDRQHADRNERLRESRQRQSAGELQSDRRTARSGACRFRRSRADDESGRAGRGQPEFAQGGTARTVAARRLHPAGEDHPFRPRAHSRTRRARKGLGARTATSSATSR